MKIEHYIRKIVDDGDRREMEELSDILIDVIDIVKRYDEDCYNEYKMKLYKMAYGNQLTEDMAEDIVKKMKPVGERWSIDETEQMQRDYGINDIKPVDFYAIMNMAFNDFRNVFGDNLETYIRYTEAFINDEDAKQGKVLNYFLTIPK